MSILFFDPQQLKLISDYRIAKRLIVSPDDYTDPPPLFPQNVYLELYKSVNKLPTRQKQIIKYELKRMKPCEICTRLKISPDCYKKNRKKAIENLKKLMIKT